MTENLEQNAELHSEEEVGFVWDADQANVSEANSDLKNTIDEDTGSVIYEDADLSQEYNNDGQIVTDQAPILQDLPLQEIKLDRNEILHITAKPAYEAFTLEDICDMNHPIYAALRSAYNACNTQLFPQDAINAKIQEITYERQEFEQSLTSYERQIADSAETVKYALKAHDEIVAKAQEKVFEEQTALLFSTIEKLRKLLPSLPEELAPRISNSDIACDSPSILEDGVKTKNISIPYDFGAFRMLYFKKQFSYNDATDDQSGQ